MVYAGNPSTWQEIRSSRSSLAAEVACLKKTKNLPGVMVQTYNPGKAPRRQKQEDEGLKVSGEMTQRQRVHATPARDEVLAPTLGRSHPPGTLASEDPTPLTSMDTDTKVYIHVRTHTH